MKAGFDWDGTISTNVCEFKVLSSLFEKVIIVTLNRSITIEVAATMLCVSREKIENVMICPDERVSDYYHWKAEIAVKNNVDLFFDDDILVVETLKKCGIPCLRIGEIPQKA